MSGPLSPTCSNNKAPVLVFLQRNQQAAPSMVRALAARQKYEPLNKVSFSMDRFVRQFHISVDLLDHVLDNSPSLSQRKAMLGSVIASPVVQILSIVL